MVANWDIFYKAQDGDPCNIIALAYEVDEDDFYAWNPDVGSDCSGLQDGVYFCVGTSSADTASTTTATSGMATPTPVQDGITSNCDDFYLVQAGDGCWAIANKKGIELDDFYSWNPAVGDDCSGLQADVYVCIGIADS